MATYQAGYDRSTIFTLLNQGGPFWWKVSHWARPRTASEIRSLLEWLRTKADAQRTARNVTEPGRHFLAAAVFLLAYVDDRKNDEALEARWRDAMAQLDGMNAYSIGSKKKRLEKLRSIARDADALAAWQAAAVGSGWLPDPLIMVLLCDGSQASVDALLPHVERALKSPERLAQFLPFREIATKGATEVFAVIDRSAQERPIIELAKRLGLLRDGRVRVRLKIPTVEQTHAETWISVELDSNEEPTLQVVLAKEHRTRNSVSTHGTQLRLKTIESAPAAIAKAAKQEGVTWAFEKARPTFMKRVECAQLLAWLAGSKDAAAISTH